MQYEIRDRVVIYGRDFDRLSSRAREEAIIINRTDNYESYLVRSCRFHRWFIFPYDIWVPSDDIYGRVSSESDRLVSRLAE